MADTVWRRITGPGETYRTDAMHYVTTDQLSLANGYPPTDEMSDDTTEWTEVTGP